MAFEFWRYITYDGAKTTTDLLALVALRGSSNILFRLASLGELVYLFEILLGMAMAVLGRYRRFPLLWRQRPLSWSRSC
jgi:hypothetical protein